jgi:hypothetical protein
MYLPPTEEPYKYEGCFNSDRVDGYGVHFPPLEDGWDKGIAVVYGYKVRRSRERGTYEAKIGANVVDIHIYSQYWASRTSGYRIAIMIAGHLNQGHAYTGPKSIHVDRPEVYAEVRAQVKGSAERAE